MTCTRELSVVSSPLNTWTTWRSGGLIFSKIPVASSKLYYTVAIRRDHTRRLVCGVESCTSAGRFDSRRDEHHRVLLLLNHGAVTERHLRRHGEVQPRCVCRMYDEEVVKRHLMLFTILFIEASPLFDWDILHEKCKQ